MRALWILLGIAAVIVLLLLLRITVDLDASDELTVTLKILFLRFRLAPRKEKPIRPKDFRIKAFRRRRLKEEKKALKKRLAHPPDKKTAAARAAEKPKRSLKENIAFGVDLVRYVASRVLKAIGRYGRIRVYRLSVTVVGDDPAKTAVAFGAVCQAVGALKALLDAHLHTSYPRDPEAVAVRIDYLSEKPVLAIRIAFSIRVWQVLAILIHAGIGYLKMPKHEPQTAAVTTKDGHGRQKNAPVTAGREG